jgi:hypothetical protein
MSDYQPPSSLHGIAEAAEETTRPEEEQPASVPTVAPAPSRPSNPPSQPTFPICSSFDEFKRLGMRLIANPPEDDCETCYESLRGPAPQSDTTNTHTTASAGQNTSSTSSQSTITQSRSTQAGTSNTNRDSDVVRIRRCRISQRDHLFHRSCLLRWYTVDLRQNPEKIEHVCPVCQIVVFRTSPDVNSGAPPASRTIAYNRFVDRRRRTNMFSVTPYVGHFSDAR